MAADQHRALIAFGAIVASIGVATAATGSDRRAAHGRDLALNVCAACHVVAKDQRFSPLLFPPAPSFMDIASRPGLTAEFLRRFVVTTHWDEKTLPLTMPNPLLTADETTDVVAYIMTLRAP